MSYFKNKGLFFSLVFISACTLNPAKDNVEVSIEMREQPQAPFVSKSSIETDYSVFALTTPPATINGFDCFAINVDGEGIPSLSDDRDTYQDLLAGGHCTGGGITSKLFPSTYSGAMNVLVPAGPNRIVQVLGFKSNIGCPAKPFSDFIKESDGDHAEGEGMESIFPGIYEVGRQVVNLFGDTTLNIQSSYSATQPKNLHHCGGETELLLIDAIRGCDNTFNNYPTLEYTSSTGTGNIATAFTLAELDNLDTYQNNTPVILTCSSNPDFPRMDFFFDLEEFDVDDYREIIVEIKALGGHAASCSPLTSPTSNYSLEFTAYRGSAVTATWATGNMQVQSNSTPSFSSYSYQLAYGGLPNKFITDIDGFDTLVVTLRSNTSLPANCRALEVYEVKARMKK